MTATDLLFADGMSDPRGGEYRSIKVRVGNVWNGGGDIITTHGWILPSSDKSGARQAVAWDGLTYEVIGDDGPADLKTDIDHLLTGEAAKSKEDKMFSDLYTAGEAEAYSIGQDSLLPIKACLLLRLGETTLAERLYQAWDAEEERYRRTLQRDREDPFMTVAGDWEWSTFNRAVCAHMRGDDHLALRDAELLTIAGPKLEAQAAARGVPLDKDYNGKTRPYFDFLAPLPQLRADSRRRVAAPEAPLTADQVRRLLATYKDASERIAFLLRHLDDVAARQDGQPGGVGLDADPICEAIIREGEDAVDPLLATMENDKRLTRSVSFGRDFFRQRDLLTVRSAASSCIVRILHTATFDTSDAHSTAAIRAYWNANRGVPLAERWYRTLANDAASPRQWLEAAKNIVQRSDIQVHGGWTNEPQRKPGLLPPMRGESLRNGHTPTVSALLARRVAEIAGDDRIPNGPGVDFVNSTRSTYYGDGITLGLTLAEWDIKTARPTLKLLMDRLRRIHPGMAANGEFDPIGERTAKLTVARAEAGDPDAANDYSAFLHDIPPLEYGFCTDKTLSTLYLLASDARFARVADTVFNDPASAWNPLITPADFKTHEPLGQKSLIGSPLLCVPAFRRQVFHELSDQRPARPESYEPQKSRDGQPITIRLCDVYANELSHMFSWSTKNFGVPRFELNWPQPERDQAITVLKAYLTQFGERFVARDTDASALDDYYSSNDFGLQFPRLDHATTAEDVRAGRAIFSLENPQARPVRMSRPLPIKAARLMAKDSAAVEQAHLLLNGKIKWEQGKPLPYVEGSVYQAEEVKENGKWQRYYGFVGLHTMERVPATEIILIDLPGKAGLLEPARF